MNLNLKLATLLIIALVSKAFNCVSQTYNFEKISAKNGLPSNTINGLDIDPKGYLWLSTIMGLYHYDGYNFLTINKTGSSKTIAITKNGDLFCQNEEQFLSLNTKTLNKKTIFPLNTDDADPNNDQYKYINC